MVAQSCLEQAVGHSASFGDQGHLGKEDMQRSWCRANQIAANKTLHRMSNPLCSIAAGELCRLPRNIIEENHNHHNRVGPI